MSNKNEKPKMKPRKYPHLWQAYLYHNEIETNLVRHKLRMKAIEQGRSNMDLSLEKDQFIPAYEAMEKEARKMMINYGKAIGPIWDWITEIKGMKSGKLPAQLLAQINDISLSPTVSSLWRFCGYAVYDGKTERNKKGEKSHYNRQLKSICYLIGEQFVRQQTPFYVDLYYAEKLRLRDLHPEKIKENGKWKYNDGHLHAMAKRKMVKIFLQHLWVTWREIEGLPVSDPYSISIMGHAKYIMAPVGYNTLNHLVKG